MKNFILAIFLLISFVFNYEISFSSDKFFDHSYSNYGTVLSKNVSNGSVNYQNIKNNISKLDQFLSEASQVDKSVYGSWSEEEKLAFLINLYNAQTLKLITDNYPIISIKDIGKPWDIDIVNLFGSKTSLNHLEHEVIRKEFNEPRIHFALVCAAKGCPILLNKPYLGSKLKKQLETSTTNFLKDSEKNYIDEDSKTLNLSPIFDWFNKDFAKKSGSVAKFLKPYFPEDAAIENYQIKYTNYDWSLNDSK